MRRFIPFLAFISMTSLTVLSGGPAFAGGCSNHTNKKTEIICAEGENECIKNKKIIKNSEKSFKS